jgi:hypothetical protein
MNYYGSRIFLEVLATQNSGREMTMGIENPEALHEESSETPSQYLGNVQNSVEETEGDEELNELQDIEDLLERSTKDGKGADEIPESNFVSYAADDVEKEEDQ